MNEPRTPSLPTEAYPAQRLHPMTLIQRFVVSLPGFVFLILPVLRSPNSSSLVTLLFAVAYGVLTIPWIFLYYWRFRYWITPREIIIHSGVLTRKHRNIPIERIHNIEIEQQLLPRLFGTAKVKIVTAGSTTAEGVLEYIALTEAQRLKQVVRSLQTEEHQDQQTGAEHLIAAPNPVAPTEAESEAEATVSASAQPPRSTTATVLPLFSMSMRRVLLSGAFRFSLLYIALAFSALQYFDADPEVLVDWVLRGPLRPYAEQAMDSPWVVVPLAIFSAVLLSWLTGILVNLNKYHRFRLWLEDRKLHKHHGLLTLAEGAIPLKRIQAIILRANPLMRRYGWTTLQLQTMGLDVNQVGHQMAAPFARLDEINAITQHIHPFQLPENFRRVSPLTVRRMFIRYTVGWLLLMLPTAYFWQPALWALTVIPLFLGVAYGKYVHHGYVLQDDLLFVRRGLILHHIWVIPLKRMQVFYTSASLFQRRLGLKSLYVDTAGAASFAEPDIVDLPAETADALLAALHTRFQAAFAQPAVAPSAAADPSLAAAPPLSRNTQIPK